MTEFKDFVRPVLQIGTGSDFTAVLDNDGNLYYSGYKNSLGDTNYTLKKYTKKLPDENILKMVTGPNNILLLTEDHKVYIEGYDYRYHIQNYSQDEHNFKHKPRVNEEEEKVVDIDVGRHYHVYISDTNKIYAAGDEFTQVFEIYGNDINYKEIPLEEGVIPKRVRCGNNNDTPKCTLLFVEKEGKSQLWSAGGSTTGMLGQGDGVQSSNAFKPLSYDTENITFAEAKVGYTHALAITDKGELYGWGSNGSKQLGMTDTKDYYVPTEIPYFKNYKVHSINLGEHFSIVKASPKDDESKTMIFNVGDVIGINGDNKTEEGILHLQDLDDADIKIIEAGQSTTLFVYDGEVKASDNSGVHHGYKCDVTGQCPIQGTMHFYKDEDGKWHYLSKQGYDKVKSELPPVCFATKYYIEDIEGKEWPEVDATQVLEETKEECEPTYVAWTIIDNEAVVPRPKSSEIYIFEKESHDINPIIFYRLARPLKDDAALPNFDLTKYHKRTDLFGIKIEADPDYSFQKNDIIMNLEPEKYESIQNRIKTFDEKHDEEIQKVLEEYMRVNSVDFIECPFLFVMASDLEWENQALRALPSEVLQLRIDSLVLFNQHFLKAIPFVLLDEQLTNEEGYGETKLRKDCLSASFILGKKYAFNSVKKSYVKKISDQLQTTYDCPTVNYNRKSIKKKYDQGHVDTDGTWSYLGLLTKKLIEKNFECFKQNSSTSQPFRAYYDNEGQDDSGTLRETLSCIIDEIHSHVLPLFIPTKNNKMKKGPNNDAWIINPSCTSSAQLQMYKCVGALMGHAFRCGNCMDFRMAPIFWKKLFCDPLTLCDVEAFDFELVETLRHLMKQKEGKPEDFNGLNLKFAIPFADGKIHSLVDDGENVSVTYDNVDDYINKVLAARFNESNKQMEKIIEGFDIIFPVDVIKLMPFEDLETRIRGQEITIEKLKSLTTYYSMSETDEWGKLFWDTIESFDKEKLTRYVRYMSGRVRIPYEEKERDLMHYINLKDNYYSSDHDTIFPDLYKYNFQMYFPRYSSLEISIKKITEHIVEKEKYYIYGKLDEAEENHEEQNNNDDIESDTSSDAPVPVHEPPASAAQQAADDEGEDNGMNFGDLFGGDDDY